jgi:hypothetical protein
VSAEDFIVKIWDWVIEFQVDFSRATLFVLITVEVKLVQQNSGWLGDDLLNCMNILN